MTARQYLDSIRAVDGEITALRCALNRMIDLCEWRASIMDTATHITPSFGDHVQGDPQSSRVESAAVRLADLQGDEAKDAILETMRTLNCKVSDLEATRKTAREIIWKIRQRNYRNVLEYRYMQGLRWPTIADNMHYSLKSVTRMHGYALQAFYEYMPKGLREAETKCG